MNEMIVFDKPFQLAPYVEQRLARSTNHMELIAAIAQEAMNEVSAIHTYGVYKAASTMMVAEALRNGAGPMTPAQQGVYEHFARAYLNQMRQITEAAGAHIVQSVNQVPAVPDEPGVLDNLINWLKTH